MQCRGDACIAPAGCCEPLHFLAATARDAARMREAADGLRHGFVCFWIPLIGDDVVIAQVLGRNYRRKSTRRAQLQLRRDIPDARVEHAAEEAWENDGVIDR